MLARGTSKYHKSLILSGGLVTDLHRHIARLFIFGDTTSRRPIGASCRVMCSERYFVWSIIFSVNSLRC